jgi:hypothetical protein
MRAAANAALHVLRNKPRRAEFYPTMNRQRILISAVILLAVIVTAKWIISGWGLITVHADNQPLSSIIRSIEKQGGIVIHTNMDAAKQTSMHVDKVPLAEAIEVLSAVSDGRARLAYIMAADAATVETGIAAWKTASRPEGWKVVEVPTMGRRGAGGDDAPLTDPRRDVWKVKEPAEKTLQAYMENAATHVSAAFACPEGFNPAVSKSISDGEIRKAAPALASAANAKFKEVFFLTGRPPGAPEGDDEDGPPRGGGGGGAPNFALVRERRLNDIAKLPPSQQAAAKAEFDEMEKVFAEVRDLPREERRAKMEEIFNRPDMMDKMDDRRTARDELRTPEQRMKRYQKYVQRKREAKQ